MMILLGELIPEWSALGIYLINYNELQIICREESADPRWAFSRVLNQWLKGDAASWPGLVAAITALGGHDELAKRIATEHGYTGAIDISIIQVCVAPLSMKFYLDTKILNKEIGAIIHVTQITQFPF